MSLSLPLKYPNGRQYSRDSFDRFGDDLCELLLSFLPIFNKFRFECVSTQWRRLIFNKVIYFDEFYISSKNTAVKFMFLKTVIKKCPNLKTVKINVNSVTVSSLPLLSDNSHRLKSIQLYIDEYVWSELMKTFGQTLGSKVNVIEFGFTRFLFGFIEMFEWFPNLKRLQCQKSDDWLSLVGNHLVPELIQLGCVTVKSGQMFAFAQLVDKYKNTMKNIVLSSGDDIVLQQLYQFKQLECLRFYKLTSLIGWFHNEYDLTPKIALLGQHCPKLSKIHLDIGHNVSLSPSSKPITSIKSLILNIFEIHYNFFANLSLLTPNLKEFKFSSQKHIYSNKDLEGLSRMKHLKRLVLCGAKWDHHSTDDSGVIQLLDNCKELKELRLEFLSNITLQTISALKELANNRPKELIRFSTKTSWNELPEVLELLIQMPHNLSIIFL